LLYLKNCFGIKMYKKVYDLKNKKKKLKIFIFNK